ncbi:hypothetical protein TIFTF001_027395 [Ficus carica]|uniref:Uncharacterized protein n=1 Tax=Ficus carica TaxID=3494 RepID=A0AA88IYE8_FICCA|nr:hypothetical protein TIFTF001_027395 [Ficus carica]
MVGSGRGIELQPASAALAAAFEFSFFTRFLASNSLGLGKSIFIVSSASSVIKASSIDYLNRYGTLISSHSRFGWASNRSSFSLNKSALGGGFFSSLLAIQNVQDLRKRPYRGQISFAYAPNDFSFTKHEEILILPISIVKSDEVVDYQFNAHFIGEHYQYEKYSHIVPHQLRNSQLIMVYTLNNEWMDRRRSQTLLGNPYRPRMSTRSSSVKMEGGFAIRKNDYVLIRRGSLVNRAIRGIVMAPVPNTIAGQFLSKALSLDPAYFVPFCAPPTNVEERMPMHHLLHRYLPNRHSSEHQCFPPWASCLLTYPFSEFTNRFKIE